MTPAQLATFKAHILANTDPAVVAAVAVRNDAAIRDWYNTATTTDAWRNAMGGLDLWDAMVATQYDGITVAAKRELWLKMIDIAEMRPFDMGKASNRNVVLDIWTHLSAGQQTTLMGKMTEKALRVELVFNAPSETAASVTAVDRSFVGQCTIDDVSQALNG